MSKLSKALKKAKKWVEKATGVKDGIAHLTQFFAAYNYTMQALTLDASHLIEQAYDETLGPIAPDEVDRFVSLNFVIMNSIIATTPAVNVAIMQAIKDGNLPRWTDLITPFVATMVKDAAGEAFRKGSTFPPIIRNLITNPHERPRIDDFVRWTTLKDMDTKAFFVIWKEFKGEKDAVTLDQSVIFDGPPDFTNPEHQFLSLHEFKHTLQYHDAGVDDFIKRYLADRFKFGLKHPLEKAADFYACSIMPTGHPFYINSCAVPPPPP